QGWKRPRGDRRRRPRPHRHSCRTSYCACQHRPHPGHWYDRPPTCHLRQMTTKETDVSSELPALLSYVDVGVSYPTGTVAIDGLTLGVAAGEFLSVVGPSGCGKSTLLRLAAGLLAPTRGRVRRSTERVGFVFQDATLLPWRTVRRNVELVGELSGLG